MKCLSVAVLITLFAASYGASLVSRPNPGLLAETQQPSSYKVVPLSRSKRWILSWLMGHTSLMEHIQGKTKTEEADSDEKVNTRNDSAESVEIHNLSKTEEFVDLSDDTRVNYLDGQGRTGSLANEGDAEVFDWKLLQEDRDRTAFNVNPHYYEFHDKTDKEEISEDSAAYSTLYSNPYGVRERTEVGYLRPAYGEATSSGSSNVRSFSRTPIAYEDSLEYYNSVNRNNAGRN